MFDIEKEYLFLLTPEALYELMVSGLGLTHGSNAKRSRESHRRFMNETGMETTPERKDQEIKRQRKQHVNLKATEPQDGGHNVGG